MLNCDVWQCQATISGTSSEDVTWGEPFLLHRTALAAPNPLNSLTSLLKESESSSEQLLKETVDEDAHVHNAAPREEVEIVCRICQATQTETPSMRMIRPCKCSGSVSFVHIDCLNTWRATSSTAFLQCSICRYEYRVQQSVLAAILKREDVLILLTVMAVCILMVSTGYVAYHIIPHVPFLQILVARCCATVGLDHLINSCDAINELMVSKQLSWIQVLDATLEIQESRENWFLRIFHKLKFAAKLFSSATLYAFILCQPEILRIVSILILGAFIVGCAMFLRHMLVEYQRLQIGGGNAIRYVVFMTMSIAQLNNAAMMRLFLGIGFAIALHEVYNWLHGVIRSSNEWLGERIQEME
mmetsp:Transcript_11704/g.17585  ORF Transcript_11704/g.17585 Transcript_11704/m.17585 type:complete len:358 (+) Transcript_11704:600-1673(+)